MSLSIWTPPRDQKPSSTYEGEASPEILYSVVGEALSRWEHMESALIKLFQLMCETPTLNACRAYSTIISATGRSGAIRAASSVFFQMRDKTDFDPIDKILKAYATAAGYRNNIAHGIAAGILDETRTVHLGYYVMCPSYGPKYAEIPNPDSLWWLGSKYFYRTSEIKSCSIRFEELLNEAMAVTISLNEKYDILETGLFHP